MAAAGTWAQSDTTPAAVDQALRELLYARHTVALPEPMDRTTNLVAAVDDGWTNEVAHQLSQTGTAQPSRTIVLSVKEGQQAIDARAKLQLQPAGPRGSRMELHEYVVLDVGLAHLEHVESLVAPLLLRTLDTIAWCPHGHHDVLRDLAAICDGVLLDSDGREGHQAALDAALDLNTLAHVVDLAWLRSAPWRARLAESFDPPQRRTALQHVSTLEVRHHQASTASALLLAGWLGSRLDWEPAEAASDNAEGPWHIRHAKGLATIELVTTDQPMIGLSGVTLACDDGFSLRFDRAPGGLLVSSRDAAGTERQWNALGSSRSERGILATGLRAAFDPNRIYAAALTTASKLLHP